MAEFQPNQLWQSSNLTNYGRVYSLTNYGRVWGKGARKGGLEVMSVSCLCRLSYLCHIADAKTRAPEESAAVPEANGQTWEMEYPVPWAEAGAAWGAWYPPRSGAASLARHAQCHVFFLSVTVVVWQGRFGSVKKVITVKYFLSQPSF